jgi:Ran GTPase-activating protein (RanGAP) involved in mRNA processing and transport
MPTIQERGVCTKVLFAADCATSRSGSDTRGASGPPVHSENEVLYLRSNEAGAVALADSLPKNKSLARLGLGGKGIGDVGMEALGQSLTQNDYLKWLDLRWNKFGIIGLTALSNALNVNKGLTTLRLDNNSIADEGAAILADMLKVNTSLRELHLGKNRIDDDGAAALGGALKVNISLAKLDLNYNNIENDGAAAMAKALKVNITLTNLCLNHNRIGDKGALVLLKVLIKFNTTLMDINLWDNDNTSSIIQSTICAFSKANNSGLRLLHAGAKVDLSSKWLCDFQAKQVAIELFYSKTVTTLILNKNDIGHPECVYLADALIKNGVLTTIELDDNSIGGDGCSAIAVALRENKALTKILLNGNSIGQAGVTALAETLIANTCLRHLELGRNNVGNYGAVVIADALQSNTHLTWLDVSCNNISNEGTMAFLATLEYYNHALTMLNLDHNAETTPRLRNTVDKMLASRRVLSSLRKCLHKPLEKRLIPLVINVWMNRMRGQPEVLGRVHLLDKDETPKRTSGSWHSTRLISTCHQNPDLQAHYQEMGAGPIFLLVRAAATTDATAITVTTSPSRKRSRAEI